MDSDCCSADEPLRKRLADVYRRVRLVIPDDELGDAARTAEIYGAKHHAVRLDRSTFESSLPHIVASLEEPVASSSIVPMYFVCQRARQVVKVA